MHREGTIYVGGVIHVWAIEERPSVRCVPTYAVFVNGRQVGLIRDHRNWRDPELAGWFGEWCGNGSTIGPHAALESILRRIIAVDRGYAWRAADALDAYAGDPSGRSFDVYRMGTNERVARIVVADGDRWNGHLTTSKDEIGSAEDLPGAMRRIATELGLELDLSR